MLDLEREIFAMCLLFISLPHCAPVPCPELCLGERERVVFVVHGVFVVKFFPLSCVLVRCCSFSAKCYLEKTEMPHPFRLQGESISVGGVVT